MKTKKIMPVDKRSVVAKLMEHGYNDMYENDVIIDVLERRSNECYTKRQAEAIKLFYPTAEYKCVDPHTYVFKTLA